MRTFALPMIWILAAQVLSGQFDLLTPREAVRIVEKIPQVMEATKKLHCPMVANVSVGDLQHPATINVEVRCGGFHVQYAVNRRTGVVIEGVVDNPSRVGDRTSEAFAQQLVNQARSRVLSLRESRCLALEAARTLPGWGGVADATTIGPVTAPSFSSETCCWLSHKALTPQTELQVTLYVDPRTGHVRNMGAADEVMSAGLGELLANLIALRSPPLLSDQDALSIALRVPALATVLDRKSCSLVASSGFTPEEAQIQPACDGHYIEGHRVTVNLRDGLVSDADTGRLIDAPDVGLLAKGLVSAAQEARLHLQRVVDARCGGPESRRPMD